MSSRATITPLVQPPPVGLLAGRLESEIGAAR